MFKLNYDNRHTFLISLSIILLIFGFYPYYTQNDIAIISIKTHVFHAGSIGLGIALGVIGISIWNKRDNDEEELRKFKKSEILRNNQMKELEIEEKKLLLKAKNLDSQIQKKENEKEKLETDYDNKLQSMEDIIKEKEELLAKRNKILHDREKAINDLPSTIDFNTVSLNNVTNPYITTLRQQPINPNLDIYGNTQIFSNDMNIVKKKCPYCNEIFDYLSTDTLVSCKSCGKFILI